MAEGDFTALIQSRVTNHACESCGQNNWNLIEEANGEERFILARPLAGGFNLPPNGFRSLLLICHNCYYVRTYIIPHPPSVSGAPAQS
jgi:hypothetical protein